MYSAETTIVDVKQTGESEYTLSMTAMDLYVAAQSGDVIRRHDVSESNTAPEKKYVALSGVKFAETTGKYTFTFASGDVFESASDAAYPTAESVSDESGGGSGGGVLVVTDTDGTLDKTWQEIHDADIAYIHLMDYRVVPYKVINNKGEYQVVSAIVSTPISVLTWVASSADGYPVAVEVNSGGTND